MKLNRITTLIIGLMVVGLQMWSLQAQGLNGYDRLMNEKVSLLDKTDVKDWLPIVAEFDRIAQVPQSDWMAAYYAAYGRAIIAMWQPERADELCADAERFLQEAERKQGDASEIACLRSLMATARFIVNPQERWMQWGAEADRQLEIALKHNDSNPRIYFLRGQMLMNTPESFGGSKTKAKLCLEHSVELYDAVIVQPIYAPHWGEKQARELVKKM
jgi:hypothetical protein